MTIYKFFEKHRLTFWHISLNITVIIILIIIGGIVINQFCNQACISNANVIEAYNHSLQTI